MQSVKKKAWQLALVLGLVPPVWATDDLLTARLIDEAHHWQEKNRYDLAANVWRKLLLVVPDHPEALAQLRITGAQPIRNRDGSNLSNPISPGNKLVSPVDARSGYAESPTFQGSSSMMTAAPKKQTAAAAAVPATLKPIPFAQPAISARDRKAVQIDVRVVKNVGAASHRINDAPAISTQSRLVPSATSVDWAQLRSTLETAAQRHPESVSAMLALTRHLSTRETTRRESLRQMADFARRGLADEKVRQSWRAALIALDPISGNTMFFARYLTFYPDDAEVRRRAQSIAASSENDVASVTATIAPISSATALRLSPSLLQQLNRKVDER